MGLIASALRQEKGVGGILAHRMYLSDVVLVMPLLFWQPFGKVVYLVIAETFAPLAECVLFRVVDMDDEAGLFRSRVRDCVAIVVANLASFLLGGWLVGMWLSYAA